MKDAIDKRNERERIARSIVKRRNIVYISQEELERRQQEEERHQQMQQEREAAEEIVRRLKEEENRKQAMEIERLLAQREMLERQLESGMDVTGKNPMDGVTQERVEAILSEKSKQLQALIAANSVEMGKENESVETSVSEDVQADESAAETNLTEDDLSVSEADAGENPQAMPDMDAVFQEIENGETGSAETEAANGTAAESPEP